VVEVDRVAVSADHVDRTPAQERVESPSAKGRIGEEKEKGRQNRRPPGVAAYHERRCDKGGSAHYIPRESRVLTHLVAAEDPEIREQESAEKERQKGYKAQPMESRLRCRGYRPCRDANYDRCQDESSPPGLSDREDDTEERRQQIELKLDLQGPCDVIDQARLAEHEPVDVEEAGREVGEQLDGGLPFDDHQEGKQDDEIEKIGRLEPREAAKVKSLQARLLRRHEIVPRKRQRDDEPADDKKQVHANAPLMQDSRKRGGTGGKSRLHTEEMPEVIEQHACDREEPQSVDLRDESIRCRLSGEPAGDGVWEGQGWRELRDWWEEVGSWQLAVGRWQVESGEVGKWYLECSGLTELFWVSVPFEESSSPQWQ
jgi:hypothetical protein